MLVVLFSPFHAIVYQLFTQLTLLTLAAQPDPTRNFIAALLDLEAPAPDWKAQTRERNRILPPAQRDWFEGPPPDDAALDILLGWWADQTWFDDDQPPQISDQLRERLLLGCEQRPFALSAMLRLLPQTPEACGRVRTIFKRIQNQLEPDSDWVESVKTWLVLHDPHFRDELIARARAASDGDGFYQGEEALEALAAIDWKAAEPILRCHLAGLHTRTISHCLSLLFQHFAESAEPHASAEIRDRLMRIVSDRDSPGMARSEACEALMKCDWPGRDDWFLNLFFDPSLRRMTDGSLSCSPLSYVVRATPDYWIPRVNKLLPGESQDARTAAAYCLEQFVSEHAREDALRPLLPWLTDPDWADTYYSSDRLGLICSLGSVELPECVPGLLFIVEHEVGSALCCAADALAHYKAAEAVPHLKAALLREPAEYRRRDVIRAIIALKGFTVDEMVAAIEAYAAEISTPEGAERVKRADDSLSHPPPLAPAVSIGRFLAFSWETPDDRVARALLKRISESPNQSRALSETLLLVRTWSTAVIDEEIVNRMRLGTIDRLSVRSALQRRDSFRAHTEPDLQKLADVGGLNTGIAAVLLGDPLRYTRILDGSDRTAQSTLFACARLIREPLPIDRIATLLAAIDNRSSANALFISAAERYLETEDSPAARRLLLSRYPGKARILGARQSFDPGHVSFEQFDQWEQLLREAVLAESGPDEIIAWLSAGYWGDNGQIVVYLRGETAELRLYRDKSTFAARPLTGDEWRPIKDYISVHAFDDLAPFNTETNDGMQYEYVHVSKSGGRRVFMNNPDAPDGAIYDRLGRLFVALEGDQTPTSSPASAPSP